MVERLLPLDDAAIAEACRRWSATRDGDESHRSPSGLGAPAGLARARSRFDRLPIGVQVQLAEIYIEVWAGGRSEALGGVAAAGPLAIRGAAGDDGEQLIVFDFGDEVTVAMPRGVSKRGIPGISVLYSTWPEARFDGATGTVIGIDPRSTCGIPLYLVDFPSTRTASPSPGSASG